MLLFRSFLLAFSLFSISVLPGQELFSLTVRVDDITDGGKLGFASVQLAGTSAGGTTDNDGQWTTELPAGEYRIFTSLLGYATDTTRFTLQDQLTVRISLRPDAQLLNTVTVSADDARLRMTRPLMGVAQLNAARIELLPLAMGEPDVFQGLQLTSGVSSAGEASNGLSIRGGTLDQNLLLLDGAPVFTPTHLFGLF
ncbi:MAG: carboxypeptidase-like regulatory domain-containing protein, partial [Bacteroidota bacterium]